MFGGQVAGQALVAAGRTVEPDRPGALAARVLPAPRRPDASRSSTRSTASATARASPPGASSRSSTAAPIFNLPASFHVDEAGPDHQDPMPDVQMAEDLPDVPGADGAAPRPVLARHGGLARARAPDRPAPDRAAELDGPGPPCAAPGRLDQGERRSCPTIRCCTSASWSTPRTSRSSTPRCCRTATRIARTSSRSPASTTRCGSTGRSAPTTGCCTTSGASRRAGRAASRKAPSSRSDGQLAVTVIQEGLMRPIRHRE